MQNCKTCSAKKIKVIDNAADGICQRCAVMLIAYNRYYESNIPIDYWHLEMSEGFVGPVEFFNFYNKIATDLNKSYTEGRSYCLAGNHGIGKTMTVTNILKKACQKNYTCLYTTLSDVVSALTLPSNEEKFLARRELTVVDFLVIDEFDQRFVGSENSADLFGRMLEHMLRTRSQNKLPVMMCSNSADPQETFSGPIRQSIDSLMNRVEIIRTLGKDVRKIQGTK